MPSASANEWQGISNPLTPLDDPILDEYQCDPIEQPPKTNVVRPFQPRSEVPAVVHGRCSAPIHPMAPPPPEEGAGPFKRSPRGKVNYGGQEWHMFNTEGQDAFAPDGAFSTVELLFPAPGEPFELQEALRAMYLKQEHLERRVETSVARILDHMQQRLAPEITEKVSQAVCQNGLVSPRLGAAAGRPVRQGTRLPGPKRPSRQTVPQPVPVAVSGPPAGPIKKPAVHTQMQENNSTGLSTIYPKSAGGVSSTLAAESSGSTSVNAPVKAEATKDTEDQSTFAVPRKTVRTADRQEIEKDLDNMKVELEKMTREQRKRARAHKKRHPHRAHGSDLLTFQFQDIVDDGICTWIVEQPAFDAVCALMILFNSVLIGITVNHFAKTGAEEMWMKILAHVCNGFFAIELVVRIIAQGHEFYRSEEKLWNAFDFTLVLFSIIDIIMTASIGQGTSSVGQGMKTIKMLRIVRIFRVFRFFKDLSLLALMIADSLKSLIWALLMLTIIIYVFAIAFTQSASDFVKQNRGQISDVDFTMIDSQFGSLMKTIYILILSMLSGISWGEVSDTLMKVDGIATFLFFFYIFFTLLAVLNIVTGVFVDNAVETARTQRDFLAQKEMQLREKYVSEMRALFHDMDDDDSGTVSWEEMDMHFSDRRVRGYFAALGIDPSDIRRLFDLIDDHKCGEVEVDEFLDGCLRFKGEAKSIDVHYVLHECKKLQNRLEEIISFLAPNLLTPFRPAREQSLGGHSMQSVNDESRAHYATLE